MIDRLRKERKSALSSISSQILELSNAELSANIASAAQNKGKRLKIREIVTKKNLKKMKNTYTLTKLMMRSVT